MNAAVEDRYPLSPMQLGMLFQSLYAPQSGVDIEQLVVSLPEELDESSFEKAWQALASRHAVLRTSFLWAGLEEPLQEVRNAVVVPFHQEDLRTLGESEQQARLEGYLREDRRQGFDLGTAPLMRVALFRLAAADYQAVWTFHHILLDGRSITMLVREVFALYEALRQEADPQLEQPRPFREFIDWLTKRDVASSKPYWQALLKGFTAITPFAVEKSTRDESFRGPDFGCQEVRLPETLASSLRSFAQSNDLTLNTLMQGAWAILLSRYSREEDVVFGATRACRRSTVEDSDRIVGLFMNTLPVRARLSSGTELLPFLKELRTQSLSVRPHEHTPLVRIKEWSDLAPGMPLFESILVFERYHMDSVLRAQGGAWSRRKFRLFEQTSYPLTLAVREDGEPLVQLVYDRHRFDDSAISRMLGHFRTVLEGIASERATRVAELPMLTELEWRQIFVEWNDTRRECPKACVHELFEQQAARTPDAVAVVHNDRRVTYRDLNEQANRLARHLQGLGVGPDVLVGICVERSVELVVGLLGILKAGGAYVPLDAGYPRERLAFMIEEARMPVLLTRGRLADALPVSGAHLVALDAQWESIARHDTDNPASGVTPDNLAYAIYTSGSTGKPKGVVISHGSLGNHMFWMQSAYPLTAEDRVLQKAPLSFDGSVWELFAPLLAGAAVVMARPGAGGGPRSLVEEVVRHGITVVQFVPSLLRLFLEETDVGRCASLKRVFCGGEALSPELQDKFFERLGADLCNLYGPTEVCINASSYVCRRGSARHCVPIGRPIANAQVYILDSYLQPVPVSVPGELHVGGAGLARGYLKRPELTAEKFISDPFSGEPGTRLYKTGDLARWLPDGNIEFLGRLDDQVKIRGFRIELGEIESVLAQHGGVGQAVVMARESPAGDNRLVAYVVPKEAQDVSSAGLRSFLRDKLPDYMAPSAFVFLESLPLMVNGKIDRKALPEPDWTRPALQAEYAPPRNDLERAVADVWADVLHVERVGIHDNFFELGGHSLLAVRLAGQLGRLYSIELPVRLLFEAPTVAALAAAMARARGSREEAIPRRQGAGPSPLSFAQQRLWFFDQMEPNSAVYNVPWATRLSGALDVEALRAALDALVARHDVLRTTFESTSEGPVQVVSPNRPVELVELDLSGLPEADREVEAQRLVQQEVRRPFDLSRDLMLQALLLRFSEGEHLLLLTLHHIASDGWSSGVAARELRESYAAFSSGRAPELPELPIQYADFAEWQRRWLTGEVLDKQLAYWKQKLAGSSVLQLPTDGPRPAVQTYRGAREAVVLPESLVRRVRALGREEGTTLFMTLLAAFQVLMHRYSGQNDISVGVPMANRNRHETQGLIGFFVNTLVLRSDFSDTPSFRQLLARVRQTAIDAYTHQDIPFEKLVEVLQPERNLSLSPLFQVMFACEETSAEEFGFPGVSSRELEVETGTAKFDLTLDLHEKGGEIRGILEYNTDLFEAATVRRMLGHFCTLVEAAVTEPDCPVSRMSMLTEPERRQVLIEWNDTRREYPQACVHELFEAQAARQPQVVAAVLEGREMNYGELDRRANQVAHQLRSLGVGPEVPVGICTERSLEMIVGMLGILKAGGAYVPLDPAYPRERLRFMLEDAQVRVLLVQQKVADSFSAVVVPVIELESAGRDFPDSKPPGELAPCNLAYVMYTSGSTGKPKGVQIEHRNVVAFLHSFQPFAFEGERRIGTNVASFSFDTSVEEIFANLCFGGTVHIIRPEHSTDARYFARYLVEHGINFSYMVPDMLERVAGELANFRDRLRLKCLVTGLAPKRQRTLQAFRDLSTSLRVLNAYGPTEVTYGATAFEFHEASEPDREVPIGRPFANYEVYIVDGELQPVPVGVVGELLIGGVGVARDYLNRPELTAEKFVPDPFSKAPGARLYKTGDLARYLPDGNIEFLGRIDNQVKIRGFRIEPGEIEAALAQHAGVERAVVAAREGPAGDKRLVAYVMPKEAQDVSAAGLRSFLRDKLPDYMVPSAFVVVESLPTMVSGKIDWKALPEPDWTGLRCHEAFLTPRDALEARLVRIWEKVLGVRPVGLRDNFFDLGGHSLLAVSLFAEMEKAFGRHLPLATLFQAPTIEQLADTLRSEDLSPAWSALVPIQPQGPRAPFFCVHAQSGNVLFYRELARHLGTDQPVYGLQAVGLDGRQPPLRSVEEMAANYLAEIRAVQPEGPYFVGGFCLGAYVALEMARRLEAERQKVAVLVSFATDGAWRTVDSFRRGITYHLTNLSGLGVRAKAAYIAGRVEFRLGRIKYTLGELICKFFLALRRPLPRALRDLHVFESNYQANRAYVAQNYGGALTYFQAAGAVLGDSSAFWGGVAARGVEVHVVPGRGEDIFREPNVAVLARHLRSCLDRAQTTTGGARQAR